MRTLKAIPAVALASLALFAASGSATARHHRPCAIPRGWKLTARDRQAVVIRQRNVQRPAYEYCSLMVGSRRAGRFTRVANSLSTEVWPVVALRLAGRYIAYETQYPGGDDYALWLADTKTGARVDTAPPYPMLPPPPEFGLSANGVAAWIPDLVPPSPTAPPIGPEVQALTDAGVTVLDSPPAGTHFPVLANLQLYGCASGCPSNATIVAWTDNGQQQYAQVSG